MISIDKFKTVVENTPLVSIDFIISDGSGNYLLGKRQNEPAKGFWFTLGGRIYKNESISEAMKRLSQQEFNLELTPNTVKFVGIYEHFYNNSFVDVTISTHYIVLGYRIDLRCDLELPMEQHSEYRYFTREEILEHDDVHTYTKDYFKENL